MSEPNHDMIIMGDEEERMGKREKGKEFAKNSFMHRISYQE